MFSFKMLVPGRVGDGLDHEAGVAAVKAGDGIAEVNGDAGRKAGRQQQETPFPS